MIPGSTYMYLFVFHLHTSVIRTADGLKMYLTWFFTLLARWSLNRLPKDCSPILHHSVTQVYRVTYYCRWKVITRMCPCLKLYIYNVFMMIKNAEKPCPVIDYIMPLCHGHPCKVHHKSHLRSKCFCHFPQDIWCNLRDSLTIFS